MNLIKRFYFPIFIVFVFSSCQSQSENLETKKLVGGPCEGCEAIFEFGDRQLNSVDTLPLFEESEPKLKITGTVFQKDTKIPAEGIILYIYQTNRKGIYETRGREKGWAKRHGFIRGWIQTGVDGKYTFYTFRPAAYPNGQESEHIHITLKEKDKNEYYIDNYVFDDDPLLTKSKRALLLNRGGSGIVKPIMEGGILTIKRDVYLGENIPNYE